MAVLMDDLHANGWDYARAMTGRFGLYDVQPPSAVSTVILILLVAIGLFNGPALPLRLRLAISVIAIAIFTAILTFLYVTWSVAGGTTIEGMQGRYLLPIVPLFLTVFRIPRLRFSVPYTVIIVVATVANAVCIAVLIHRYW